MTKIADMLRAMNTRDLQPQGGVTCRNRPTEHGENFRFDSAPSVTRLQADADCATAGLSYVAR
jgi:hypothetical protein